MNDLNEAPVRLAVIGCGRIAGHHCRSAARTAGVDLVAVCDLDPELAARYGNEFGVPHFINFHEMLRTHPEVNTVAVITPSGMHLEHALEVLKRYRKHVIVEKPLVLRTAHVQELLDEAEAQGVRVFPVFQNRHNLAVRRVRQALENGELGALRIASVRVRWCRPQRYYDLAPWRGTWAMDGGCMTNQGVHHIDLLRSLGGEVDRVSVQKATLGADIEVEDTAVAVFRFKSGAVGNLEITTAARPG
jgi:UDP-N-acetyl-2-amino-2-deoxyglucuronate dehydrogenase